MTWLLAAALLAKVAAFPIEKSLFSAYCTLTSKREGK